MQCHYCKQTRHIQRYCPNKRADFNDFSADKITEPKAAPMGKFRFKEATEPGAKIWKVSSGPMVVQPVFCNGIQVDAIIDTGACLSAISPSLLKKFNTEGTAYEGSALIMASGQEVKPKKEFEINIFHPSGAKAKAIAAVLEMEDECLLLSSDILRQFRKFTVEYQENDSALMIMTIDNRKPDVEQQKQLLIVKDHCQIPTRSIKRIPIYGLIFSRKATAAIIEPARDLATKKGITTGHAIIKSEEIETVLIANTTSKAKWIPQQTVVGAAIEIDTFEQETTEQKIEASRNVIANIPPKEETRSEMKFDEQIASSIDPEEREN